MVSRTVVGEVAQPRVLLVDDEVRWVEAFAATLAKTGLEVKACYDGPSAIDLLRNWPADVVLLDERMPGMSGHEVCRHLRAGGYSGAILIYSAYDTMPDLVLAHEAGADDHVSKAADPLVLQAKIRRAVERVRERRGPPSSRPGRPSGIRDLLRDLERGQPIDWGSLTQLEERLLCMLACARGKPVSAEALLLDGWDRADLPSSKLYEPISNLREKLSVLGYRIQNVRGRGYQLEREPGDEKASCDGLPGLRKS